MEFDKLFETAEIAKFTEEQMRSYEDSLKNYRDLKNSLDTAKEEGKIEGKMEGKIEGRIEGVFEGKLEVAKNLLKSGISMELIMKATGFTEDEIKSL